MNLFQKTPVFSLSLLFWLHQVGVQDTCISFLSHLLISLFPVIYFDLSITRIPDNSNFFRFTQKVLSGVDCMLEHTKRQVKSFFFRYVFSPKSLFIFIYYLRPHPYAQWETIGDKGDINITVLRTNALLVGALISKGNVSVSIARKNWTYSEEICNKFPCTELISFWNLEKVFAQRRMDMQLARQ